MLTMSNPTETPGGGSLFGFRSVAQLVEHRSPKPGAGGSRPSTPATLRDCAASGGGPLVQSKGGRVEVERSETKTGCLKLGSKRKGIFT
jgi:hypothetical protein